MCGRNLEALVPPAYLALCGLYREVIHNRLDFTAHISLMIQGIA